MLTKNEIKLIKSLSDRSARRDAGLFVVEGDKMVREVLDSALRIERLFVTERSMVRAAAAECISPKEMERISHLKTPSDSLALVAIPEYGFSADMFDGLVIALDSVQDPGNMGTIIRLADWFGVSDILCSEDTVDCYNPKVVQATMGALLRVKVHYVDLPAVLAQAASHGADVYGTFLEGDDIYKAPLASKGIVVMGNEGKGISHGVASSVSRKLFIPPYPTDRRGSESLNVATATAIICSEFRRRQ